MTKIFGIIGKKFSGKSTAAKVFRKQFIPIVDLDSMYRSIFQPGNIGHKILISNVGEDVIDNNGFIDMIKLSFLICKEQWIRNLVDDILDKEFESVINKLKNAFDSHDIILGGIESYILGSTQIVDSLDFIILIDSNEEERIKRMSSIGIERSMIDKIINTEASEYTMVPKYVIKNNGTINELENKVFDIIVDIKNYEE